jgi:enoyl-CoA hydratase/carnithine racemase
MAGSVEQSVDAGLATLRIGRKHGNAINPELCHELVLAYRRAASDPEVRGVLFAASGKLFCPGLDIQELIELDRPAMERFLAGFSELILTMYSFEKPVVAALHGHTIAGGCVLSLTVDRRVLATGAMIGLNEIKVGVPLPFGVAMILRDSVCQAHLEEVALFGRNYTGDEAIAAGLAHEVRPVEGFEASCLESLGELASRDAQAFAITKRYLRSATVERIRANEGDRAQEFLDSWFSAETRERLQAIVDKLRSR